ncbi:molybdopterin-dependent oxidoreductase [Chloroflexota bacterium]
MVAGSKEMVDNERVVKTLCKMCYLQCGIDVYVRDGKIVKVAGMKEHPLNKGEICIKAEQAIPWVYSENRLRYPIKKQNGEWQRISWDEALHIMADKLKEAKQKHGDTSLIYITGDPTGMSGPCGSLLGHRFCDIYGTPYRSAVDAICYIIRGKAAMCTTGKFNIPDGENARCIILWGHNPHSSMLADIKTTGTALAKGAKLIVIDPRKIDFARNADIHVQPRPGTDAALALGLVNVIINEKLYDREFVEQWTHGFDKLAERAAEYPPERVEKITWVPAEQIRQIARMFASIKPACIIQGTNTLDQQASGFQVNRLFVILQSITGNIDIPGGYIRVSGNLRLNPTRIKEKVESLKLIGAEQYPIMHQVGKLVFGQMQSMEWPDAVLLGEPPITVGIVQGSNPAVTWPNTTKVRQALEKLEFLVVMDMFMTETAKMADLILPAATFFETTDLSYASGRLSGAPWVMLRKQAIEPLGESWPDWKLWFELGQIMGFGEYFPWKSLDEYLEYLLEPMASLGVSLKGLRDEHPEGVAYGAKEYGDYGRGFQTRTKKIELYSETLKDMGYDPLPYYEENPETPVSDPELAKEYPVVLTTGARIAEYWHSMYRDVAELHRTSPDALAEIHYDTAKKYGIKDGDMMSIETKRGRMEIKAKATKDVVQGVVVVPHGWADHNVNYLTDNKHADPVTGYPVLKGILCRIGRVDGPVQM